MCVFIVIDEGERERERERWVWFDLRFKHTLLSSTMHVLSVFKNGISAGHFFFLLSTLPFIEMLGNIIIAFIYKTFL